MSAKLSFPSKLGQQRELLTCGIEGPNDVARFGYAGSFASLGVDDSFSLDKFKTSCKLEIIDYAEDRVIFELIGIDVSIANALRRIMIAEVPTVAIETVHLYQNTGVIQDEVLAHRLGLIPFVIDPSTIDWRKVYASDLQWIPMSKRQQERFSSTSPRPVEPKILITKLRPGQEIEAELFCEKGIGKTHAKWSPVATAVYRLLPKISFPMGELRGDEAVELKELCPMDVFDIEDDVAVAPNPKNCTTCRACLERFPGRVAVDKVKDYFIFSVESTGSIPATAIFEQAVAVLREKAAKIKDNLQTSLSQSGH